MTLHAGFLHCLAFIPSSPRRSVHMDAALGSVQMDAAEDLPLASDLAPDSVASARLLCAGVVPDSFAPAPASSLVPESSSCRTPLRRAPRQNKKKRTQRAPRRRHACKPMQNRNRPAKNVGACGSSNRHRIGPSTSLDALTSRPFVCTPMKYSPRFI